MQINKSIYLCMFTYTDHVPPEHSVEGPPLHVLVGQLLPGEGILFEAILLETLVKTGKGGRANVKVFGRGN